jgi:Flp pilus assembly protein TadD
MRPARGLAGLALIGVLFLGACGPSSHQTDVDVDARLRFADSVAESGNPEMAVSMYQRAAAEAPADIKMQVRSADAVARLGQPTTAQAMLTAALHTSPGQPALLHALGRTYIVSDQPARSLPVFDGLLAHNPNDVTALVDKAIALDLLNRHAEAQDCYTRAMRLAPDDPVVRTNYALSRALQGHLAEATAMVRPLSGRTDLPERVRTNVGLIYAAAGDTVDSEQVLSDRASNDADVTALAEAMRARASAPASAGNVQVPVR